MFKPSQQTYPPVPSSMSTDPLAGVGRRMRWQAGLASILLVAAITVADSITGYEIRLAMLYLVPVALVAWLVGVVAGIMIAALAAVSWLVAFHSAHLYSDAIYYYWEGAILFITLAIFAYVLARLRQALLHADTRFVTVLEGLEAAVYVDGDAGGTILYSNRRFREMFGGAITNIADFERGFHATPADFFERANAPDGNAASVSGELYLQADRRWYLIRASRVTWTDGRMVSLKVMADITEAKLAEETARTQGEKLQMSARVLAIGEMASALAHELNQPLTAIASYNQASIRLLRGGEPAREVLLATMEKCSAQAVRAGSIVNRMREFLRRREPARVPGDLNAIVQQSAQIMELEATRDGVPINLLLAPMLPPVLCDSVMIQQVLVNLVRNAIEAMQETAATARAITITTAADGAGNLQVSVQDHGHGIDADVAKSLFTAFFTTKQLGMGIGLNISRSIVEFHGGKLQFQPAAGGGTVFLFTLPGQSA